MYEQSDKTKAVHATLKQINATLDPLLMSDTELTLALADTALIMAVVHDIRTTLEHAYIARGLPGKPEHIKG
jgi:hypothetical protein